MSLRNNIQGTQDGRLENANNSNAILRVSPSDNNSFPISGTADAILKEKLSDTKVRIYLDGHYLSDPEYGNTIMPYEFMRFYLPSTDNDWMDIKISKIENSSATFPYTNVTLVEGIIVRGTYESLTVSDSVIGLNIQTVKWSFYTQKEFVDNAPTNLYVGDITDTTATFSWSDPTPKADALVHQAQWRAIDSDAWNRTEIGGWIDEVEIRLQGARWPVPTTTYLGKNVYWMEFSEPDIKEGAKAEGYVEIVNGNYGEIFITNKGSGYRFSPKVKLYYRPLANSRIEYFDYRIISSSIIRIDYVGHPFYIGDEVNLNINTRPNLKGRYEVVSAVANQFFVEITDITLTPIAQTFKAGGIIELAPIALPLVPGELFPVISKDKYYITNLLPNKEYEVSVNSYFSEDLKKYSDYAKSIFFKTRP